MIPFAIQCYSVRDHLERDLRATLRNLKKVGYDHVELFGLTPENAASYAEACRAAKLRVISAHVGFETLERDPEAMIEAAKRLYTEYLVVPWLERDTEESWLDAARVLNSLGERTRARGVRLGYHNHEHEFRKYGAMTAFDLLFESTNRDFLFLELDVYWAYEGGAEPLKIIRKFGKRCPLVHVKDRSKNGAFPFAELGKGMTDWDEVFRAGREVGVEWYIVEQDESSGDSLQSAAISAEFMKSRQ